MQGRSHATTGARAIGARRTGPTWGDAFSSIMLVGSATTSAVTSSDDSTIEQIVSAGSPIDAARSWLSDPTRTAALPPSLVACAVQTLDVADAHFRDLDDLAAGMARDAAAVGVLDDARLRQLDSLAEALDEYASTLRRLLDPQLTDPVEAERRIHAGLRAAANSGGGLRALVIAL
ncbi:MAG: hypothetical protein JWM98_3277 [Thermoleophilia bacterium]|nr:hypothetical protein [Thermoleophilia bacterium]